MALSVLDVAELALERARGGSSTPLGDVLAAAPDAPVDYVRRLLDEDAGLYAKVRSGCYAEALEILVKRLTPKR